MNAIGILIVLAGTALCIQAALPKVGECTGEDYYNKIRNCMTKFIKGLQQNPKDDCKVHRESFINCSAIAVQTCFPNMTVDFMRKVLEPQLTEDLMCKRAGLQFVDPLPLNLTLPCSITTSEYMAKNNECSDKMVKKWSANRADTTLCSEYTNVKKCLNDNIKKYCTFTGILKEMVEYEYNNYNPFCANGVDPTSKVSSNAVSKAVIVMSLIAAAVQAF